ncbi:hypothetical protein, partial [Klebsiella pneumoniae]
RADTKAQKKQYTPYIQSNFEEHARHSSIIPKQKIWTFKITERLLTHDKIVFELTKMECAIVKILVNESNNVVSNEHIH